MEKGGAQVPLYFAIYCVTFQSIIIYCVTLQYIIIYCVTLQYITIHYNTFPIV